MKSRRLFQSTSIHLSAAILVQIPGTTLAKVSDTPSIDGKRLIVLDYPADQAEALHRVVEQFHDRCLTLAIYPYNRALNMLRDRLMSGQQMAGSNGVSGHTVQR